MVQLFTMMLFTFVILRAIPAAAFMQPKLDGTSLAIHQLTSKEKSAATVKNYCRYTPPRSILTNLNLFGNLFGEKVEDDQQDLLKDELARLSHRLSPSDNPATKFDSLSTMILEWGKFFTDKDKRMGLSTPVMLVELPKGSTGGDITNQAGVQLLFLKTQTGYADKDKRKEDKPPGKEEAAVKEGGVEVRLEQLVSGDLQVVASRCEVEEGTMIKEMSEEVIIDSLRKAFSAWKKEQGL